jgi:hypothetical protein
MSTSMRRGWSKVFDAAGRQCEPWIPIAEANETKLNLLLLLQEYDSAERTPLIDR